MHFMLFLVHFMHGVGYSRMSYRQRIAAFIHWGVRRSFCPPDLSIDELVSNMDDKLFNCITSDEHNVPHQLLPPECPDCGYSLRPRRHELCHVQILARWSELYAQNAVQTVLFLWRYEPVRRTGKSDDWLTIFARIVRLTDQKFPMFWVIFCIIIFSLNYGTF